MTDTGSARVFLDENGIISDPCHEDFPYQHGIGAFLFEKMTEIKDKVAQIDSITGERDTYESFLKRCIRTAITMRSKGITPDDIITVCSSNHLNTCVPLVASFFLGVKFANTDPNISLADNVFLLKQVQPKMVFASTDAVELIENSLKEANIDAEIIVFGESSEHSQFKDFLVESKEEEHFVPFQVKDIKETAAIFFSSGTTGLPKGICVTHKGLLAQTLEVRKSAGAIPFTLLVYSSAYWISLTVCFLITTVGHGCRLIVPNFDANKIWSLVEKYKVTMAILCPTEVAILCQNGRPEGIDTSSLMICAAGGSSLSSEQILTIRSMLPNTLVLVGYGQTEVGGGAINFKLSSQEDIQLAMRKPSSSGRPVPGFLIKVVDPETEEVLGPNKQGELRLKTDYQMNGYYNLDSSDVWDSDGYIKTGDIVYYDEDYCFYIVDRIKEMLKYQGWQIVPAKLEGILMTHPAVECAAVIGLPDPIDGDHPMGIVSLSESYVGFVTPEEIKEYLDERVSDKQKLKGGVKIIKSIPITPTGKFRKKYLKELILAGQL